MASRTSSSLLVALSAATLLLLPACDSAVDVDDTGGTTGGTTSESTSGPPATSSTTVPATSSSTDPSTTTVSPGSSTGSTGEEMTTSTSDTEGSSSTGEPGDCVDEDIGEAIGAGVASGTNDGQGDDFVLRYCDGGFESSTSASTTGPDDTGGGGGTTVDPPGSTTGAGGGTTGGFDDSGDDYVVSWTPPSSGPFVLDTFGSGIDTVLSVVAPKCGASRGDCNDDCDGLESGLIYEATEGETVFIVIEGYSGRQGTFVLNIAEGGDLECGGFGTSSGGFDTDGPMTSSTSAGTSVGTSP